jgi:hypothetical protein
MRPAIEAGLMVLLQAADPYMRPVLNRPHRQLLSCAMMKKRSAAMVTKDNLLPSRHGPKTVLLWE